MVAPAAVAPNQTSDPDYTKWDKDKITNIKGEVCRIARSVGIVRTTPDGHGGVFVCQNGLVCLNGGVAVVYVWSPCFTVDRSFVCVCVCVYRGCVVSVCACARVIAARATKVFLTSFFVDLFSAGMAKVIANGVKADMAVNYEVFAADSKIDRDAYGWKLWSKGVRLLQFLLDPAFLLLHLLCGWPLGAFCCVPQSCRSVQIAQTCNRSYLMREPRKHSLAVSPFWHTPRFAFLSPQIIRVNLV